MQCFQYFYHLGMKSARHYGLLVTELLPALEEEDPLPSLSPTLSDVTKLQ